MYMYLRFVPIGEIYILSINIETKVMSPSVFKYNSSTTTISLNRFYFICSSIGKYQFSSCEMKSIVLYRDWILKTVMVIIRFRIMVFNVTFNKCHPYCGGQFYCWRKLKYPEKTKPSTCRKSLTKLSYTIVSITFRHERDSNASGDRHWLHR